MPLKLRPKRSLRAARPRDVPCVLYVEDEDLNWEVARMKLSPHYNLVRARNCRETFEQLRTKGPVALVLMDIQLKGSDYDGTVISEFLRCPDEREVPPYAKGVEFDPATPIFFITGHKREDFEGGRADRVFTKPVDFGTLTQVMHAYLS